MDKRTIELCAELDIIRAKRKLNYINTYTYDKMRKRICRQLDEADDEQLEAFEGLKDLVTRELNK